MSNFHPHGGFVDNSYWATKYSQVHKHAHEHHRNPNWYKHEKHVMIFTHAARPIFTKFGDENKLSAFIGVISAFIANFQRLGETLDYFVAGDYSFVFLLCGPIYLVSISNTGEAVSSIRTQLHLAHAQILSVLGGGIHETLESRPNYDVRQLMGGTELLLNDILTSCDSTPQHVFLDVAPARLNKHTRAKVASALRKHKPKNALYALVVAAGRVAAVHKHKDYPLHVADVHVLLNVVTNSQSLRAGEAWTPICLPAFSSRGFLYAYVCYLSPAVALCIVDSDPLAFPACAAAKHAITAALAAGADTDAPVASQPLPPAMSTSMSTLAVAPAALVDAGEFSLPLGALAELEVAARLQAWQPSEVEGAGPELLHVYYRSLTGGQCVVSAPLGPHTLATECVPARGSSHSFESLSLSPVVGLPRAASSPSPSGSSSCEGAREAPLSERMAAGGPVRGARAAAADVANISDGMAGSSVSLCVASEEWPCTPHTSHTVHTNPLDQAAHAEALPLLQPLQPLLLRYRQLFAQTHGAPPSPECRVQAGPFTRPQEGAVRHALYVQAHADALVVLLSRAREYELYLTCSPLTNKEAALAAAHRVLRWVKRQEANLFLP